MEVYVYVDEYKNKNEAMNQSVSRMSRVASWDMKKQKLYYTCKRYNSLS